MSEKKEERKPVKVGTHGHTTNERKGHAFATGNPELAEKAPQTLQSKDRQEWLASKAKKAARRAATRAKAKAQGLKLGRWQGSVAVVKNRKMQVVVIGLGGFLPGSQTQRFPKHKVLLDGEL